MATSTTGNNLLSNFSSTLSYHTASSYKSGWRATTTATGKPKGPVLADPNFVLALYILMGIVALVGIIGNVCVCFIVIRGKKMYTIANLFLMNLAVADIFVLAICYPLTIIRNVMDWPFGAIMCKILPSISDSFYGVSMGCITAIAIYRYRMILHPMTSHISFKHAKITVIVIWIIALFVISVPLCWVLQLETRRRPITSGNLTSANLTLLLHPLLDGSPGNASAARQNPTAQPGSMRPILLQSKKYMTITKCVSQWPSSRYREIYQIVQISWYILPLSVILFTYIRIRTYLKKTMRYEWTKSSGDDNAPQTGLTGRVIGIKRALTLLAPVVITFALLMFPWNLFRLLSLIMDIKTKIKYVYSYIEIAGAMMTANSCSNPFIYYIMSKDFREEFRRQFRLLTRCYKLTRGDSALNRCSLKSNSFKTKVEMLSNDDSQCLQDADKADGFNRSYDKYFARESDFLITRQPLNQIHALEFTASLALSKEQTTEYLCDPDRETIL